jgi:predicted short-subunit dehydrogenase-like oxidoreductase (DUF2520 family)
LLEAEVVVLAVRDTALTDVARLLVGSGLVTRNHVLLHCSGAVSAEEALSAVRADVGGIGTLHPLRAIPDGRSAMRGFAGTVFGIEGDDRGRRLARELVAALGGRALELTGARMAAYHAAAAVASNYVVVLLDLAAELLGQAGIEDDVALSALLPLVESTVGNLRERGVAAALTGPIRRGDAETVGRHLAALTGRPEELALYRALGRRAVELASRAGAPDAGLAEVRRLLTDAPADVPAAGTGGRSAAAK